jgi:hypothetical protein
MGLRLAHDDALARGLRSTRPCFSPMISKSRAILPLKRQALEDARLLASLPTARKWLDWGLRRIRTGMLCPPAVGRPPVACLRQTRPCSRPPPPVTASSWIPLPADLTIRQEKQAPGPRLISKPKLSFPNCRPQQHHRNRHPTTKTLYSSLGGLTRPFPARLLLSNCV